MFKPGGEVDTEAVFKAYMSEVARNNPVIRDPWEGKRANDFKVTDSWRLPAIIYKELIWQSTNAITGDACEMTHSGYRLTDDIERPIALDLCLALFRMPYSRLAAFFEQHPATLPRVLRDQFDVYIGFNFGRKGGLKIGQNDITLLTQGQYMKDDSYGSVGLMSEDTDDLRFTRHFDLAKFTQAFFEVTSRVSTSPETQSAQ